MKDEVPSAGIFLFQLSYELQSCPWTGGKTRSTPFIPPKKVKELIFFLQCRSRMLVLPFLGCSVPSET